VSVVPAYGLTTSVGFNGECYAFGFSSNKPACKGWLPPLAASVPAGSGMRGPDTATFVSAATCGGAVDANHFGDGAVDYKWTIAPGGVSSFPGATITIRASGCVNTGGAQFTVSGLPAGYKLELYQTKGTKASNGCGTVQTSSANFEASRKSLTALNPTATISAPATTEDCVDQPNKDGKVYWPFDIVPI
jgi:hypothetical protein